MKVLQINAVYGTSSTGRITEELDCFLQDNGIESIVAVSQTTKQKNNLYQIGGVIDHKLHALFSRISGLQGYYSLAETKKLIHWIEKESPDIIHLHNLHANYIHLPMLLQYIAKKDIATVLTLHDCWFFTGKCTHYTTEKCYKWQEGCHNCPKLKADNKSWFFDQTSKMWADKKRLFSRISRLAVIGVSDWITNEAKKSFLQNASMVKRIYNWINLDVFYPRKANIRERYCLPKDKFLVFCISAGWSKNSKRSEDLIALAKGLPEDVHLLVAGNLDEDIQLPQNVTALGYISSTEELAELYSGVDVYVHLSREDTFGKVIAENLACGTPAIVYNSTACPELIGEGCGYVVATGNIEELKNAIDLIKENGKSYYSNKCIEYVKNNFEKEKLIKEIIGLYIDLGEINSI